MPLSSNGPSSPDDLNSTLSSSLETQSPGPEFTEKSAVLQAQSCVVAQLLQKSPWLLADLSSVLKIL
ncbi:NACHT domain- and WD repeat-containing protein 1 [Grus japonensis]|uniref:NACHT domain- and WD repeat-containing protein 1 n=1 Tax=Grus japonensis TaxID=30415 RepID=A0ABC9XVG7_GRUJA